MKKIGLIILCIVLFVSCKHKNEDLDLDRKICVEDSILYEYSKLLLSTGEKQNPIIEYLSDGNTNDCTILKNIFIEFKQSEFKRLEDLNQIDEPNLLQIRKEDGNQCIYRLFVTDQMPPHTDVYRIILKSGNYICIKKSVDWDSELQKFLYAVDTFSVDKEEIEFINNQIDASYFWFLNMNCKEKGQYSHNKLYTIECINTFASLKYNRVSFEAPLQGDINLLVNFITSIR